MKPRRIALVSVFVAAVLTLTACGSPVPHSSSSSSSSASPSASHTAKPSPTPTPTTAALVAAQLQLTHDGVVVVSTTKVTMTTIPFSSNPETAVAQIGTYVGTGAVITFTPAGQCNGDMKTAVWTGNSLRIWWNTDSSGGSPMPPWIAESRASTIGSVVVDTAQGFKVGDSSYDYYAGTPGASQPNGAGEIWSELDSSNSGVLAAYDNHVITLIQAPAYVGQDC
ncbi:MAG: hypothetical protein JWN80_2421 [Microbacteriaceae bacterium]|nr:hypothetical protein [Microbacteriaceae bacterium]